jgi:hypothetical protein
MIVACDDMNSIIQEDLDKGEAIYPGKLEWLEVHPGKGKAWVYWIYGADSRVSKTVITWTVNGKTDSREKPVNSTTNEEFNIQYDSLEITGLEEGYYSFSAYTVDKDAHRSITVLSYPENVHVYGDIYIGALSPRGIATTEMLVGGNLRVNWLNPSDEMLYSVVTYTDYNENPSGVTKVDTVPNSETSTTFSGLKRLRAFSVKSVFQPKDIQGVGIYVDGEVENLFHAGYDTVSATINYYPTVVEKEILAAHGNGFTQLNADAAAQITKLSFPLGTENSWTLRDLYLFPNLRELDLTPGTQELPTLTYDLNGVQSTVGGGDWLHIVSGYMSDNNRNIIKDLLQSGQLTKITYTRSSYPRLDGDLEPYGDKITWVPAEPLPDAIMIPNNLRVDYRVENKDRGATVEYAADGSNVPPEIAEKFSGELKNVYKVTVTSQNSTIAFSVPTDLQFGMVPHGRFKFDIFVQTTDPEYSWMKPAGVSKYEGHKTIRVFRESRFTSFPDHSPYTTNVRENRTYYNNDNDLGTWKSEDWNLVPVPHEHIRVMSIQFGADGVTWGLPSGQTLTFYVANVRFTK